MRRKLVFAGIILLSIGIVAVVFSLWQTPLQEKEAYDVPQSSVVLHETFIVPAGGETVRPINLTIWDQLHIYYSSWGLGYGHYGDINFMILDETNYLKWEAGEPYDKLVYLSQTARYNQYCLITHDGTGYFVWDNKSFRQIGSSQPSPEKEVYTEIIRNWNETAYRDVTVYHTVVPSDYSAHVEYLGIGLGVAGVVVKLGIVSKEKRDEID